MHLNRFVLSFAAARRQLLCTPPIQRCSSIPNWSIRSSSSDHSQQQPPLPHFPEKMFIVAITGGIATGKSTVTNVFRSQGVPVVDADIIAREGIYIYIFVVELDFGL